MRRFKNNIEVDIMEQNESRLALKSSCMKLTKKYSMVDSLHISNLISRKLEAEANYPAKIIDADGDKAYSPTDKLKKESTNYVNHDKNDLNNIDTQDSKTRQLSINNNDSPAHELQDNLIGLGNSMMRRKRPCEQIVVKNTSIFFKFANNFSSTDLTVPENKDTPNFSLSSRKHKYSSTPNLKIVHDQKFAATKTISIQNRSLSGESRISKQMGLRRTLPTRKTSLSIKTTKITSLKQLGSVISTKSTLIESSMVTDECVNVEAKNNNTTIPEKELILIPLQLLPAIPPSIAIEPEFLDLIINNNANLSRSPDKTKKSVSFAVQSNSDHQSIDLRAHANDNDIVECDDQETMEFDNLANEIDVMLNEMARPSIKTNAATMVRLEDLPIFKCLELQDLWDDLNLETNHDQVLRIHGGDEIAIKSDSNIQSFPIIDSLDMLEDQKDLIDMLESAPVDSHGLNSNKESNTSSGTITSDTIIESYGKHPATSNGTELAPWHYYCPKTSLISAEPCKSPKSGLHKQSMRSKLTAEIQSQIYEKRRLILEKHKQSELGKRIFYDYSLHNHSMGTLQEGSVYQNTSLKELDETINSARQSAKQFFSAQNTIFEHSSSVIEDENNSESDTVYSSLFEDCPSKSIPKIPNRSSSLFINSSMLSDK